MMSVREHLLAASNVLMERIAAAPLSSEAVRCARLATAIDDVVQELEEL